MGDSETEGDESDGERLFNKEKAFLAIGQLAGRELYDLMSFTHFSLLSYLHLAI